MTVQERRDKLLKQFRMMIQDEQKMDQLESLLQEMLNSDESVMDENQKKETLEIKDQVASGEMKTTPWNQLRDKLDLKYGI
ncbi:MAG: hypothetical protein AB8B56_16615 [Crocinitomicaceae bacterium]